MSFIQHLFITSPTRNYLGIIRLCRLLHCQPTPLLNEKPPGLRSYIVKLNKELYDVKANSTSQFYPKVPRKAAIKSEAPKPLKSSSDLYATSAISGATLSDSQRRALASPHSPTKSSKMAAPSSMRQSSNPQNLTVDDMERERKWTNKLGARPSAEGHRSPAAPPAGSRAPTAGGKSLRKEELLDSEIAMLRSRRSTIRTQSAKPTSEFRAKSVSERPTESEPLPPPTEPEAAEDTFGLIGGTKMAGVGEADLENIEDAGMSPASEELDPSTLRPFGRYNVNWYNMRIEKLVNEGRLAQAMDLFERVMLRVDRVRPDVFAPTVLINACGRAGFLEKASHLFLLLERLDLPAHPKTITGLFTACANAPDKAEGLKYALELKAGLLRKEEKLTQINYNAMILAFAKCGSLQMSIRTLDEMLEKQMRVDSFTLSALLRACEEDAANGLRHALLLWRRMRALRPASFPADASVYTRLLKCVAKCSLGEPALIGDLFVPDAGTGTGSAKLVSFQDKSHPQLEPPAALLDSRSSSDRLPSLKSGGEKTHPTGRELRAHPISSASNVRVLPGDKSMTVLIGSQQQLSEADAVQTAQSIDESSLAERFAFDSPINLLALGVPPRPSARKRALSVGVGHRDKLQQQQAASADVDTGAAKSIGPLPTRKTRIRLLREAATAAATSTASGLPSEVGLDDEAASSPDGGAFVQTTTNGLLPNGFDYVNLLGPQKPQGTPSTSAIASSSPSTEKTSEIAKTTDSASASAMEPLSASASSAATANVQQQQHFVPAAVSFGFASLSQLPSQRLALLGGVRGVFEEMARDGLRPNLYTFTALLDLLPATSRAENALLQLMRLVRVRPDVDFFNLLILRRASRADLDGAREVLGMFAANGFALTIATFGALATGCRKRADGMRLLLDMKEARMMPNHVVMGTLLSRSGLNFAYKLGLLKHWLSLGLPVREGELQIIEKQMADGKKLIQRLDAGKPIADDVPEFVGSEWFRTSFHTCAEFYERVWLPAMRLDTHAAAIRRDPFALYREGRKQPAPSTGTSPAPGIDEDKNSGAAHGESVGARDSEQKTGGDITSKHSEKPSREILV